VEHCVHEAEIARVHNIISLANFADNLATAVFLAGSKLTHAELDF